MSNELSDSYQKRLHILDDLALTVGRTRVIELDFLNVPNNNRIFLKEEWSNPTGTHYDRVYLHLLRERLLGKEFDPDRTPLIETTSGSSGRSFAYFCHELGLIAHIVVPKGLPKARLSQIMRYAPTIHIADGPSVKSAVKKLRELLVEDKRRQLPKEEHLLCIDHSYDPRSLDALAPFGEEVHIQFPNDSIDYFIGAFGNGTSLLGMGRSLLKYFPEMRIYAAEPEEATPAYNFLHGISSVPKQDSDHWNHEVLGTGVLDVTFPFLHSPEFLQTVDDSLPVVFTQRQAALTLLQEKGELNAGPSTALCLAGALTLSESVHNKKFLIIGYDDARYYSESWIKGNLG